MGDDTITQWVDELNVTLSLLEEDRKSFEW